MNREDVARRVAQRLGIPVSHVKDVLNEILAVKADALSAGEEIVFETFGVYRLKRLQRRRAYDFEKRERVWLPEVTSVHFKPARHLQERVRDRPAALRRTHNRGLRRLKSPFKDTAARPSRREADSAIDIEPVLGT